MYEERPACLPGAVVWHATVPAGAPLRVLPDGCMDLVWTGEAFLVAGPDTTAHLVDSTPDTGYTGVRFPPGTAPAALGTPAHELRDQRVRLSDIWSEARVRSLTQRAADSTAPAGLLDALAADLLRASGPTDPLAGLVTRGARAGLPVSTLARRAGMSERQLHRRCLAAFGYGAKTLARILRMCEALDMARRGVPWVRVAALTGYSDQAHLVREVRSHSGLSPSALVT
ncbi:AraC family transcriptional regulator [Haloactinospora alba]|uniref:AraC family transcriptional regulator n=1 Tax=Haloactinospora alba TaxID=405555 RepID=A0A543NA27_9ACTN|nr:helix-turn-helix transcriptional regulator [Haloactinospora alba]TQN28684.1 AraC family transcriptional regulator [Haloactinospora alba]